MNNKIFRRISKKFLFENFKNKKQKIKIKMKLKNKKGKE